jgi:hypothetical protein
MSIGGARVLVTREKRRRRVPLAFFPGQLMKRNEKMGETKQIVAIYTYIPVISNTKWIFVSCVGLSLPSFLIFMLYQLISLNIRCIAY